MQSYPTLSQYLKKTFNKKMIKLPIDGGFTCPNREYGNKGCIFCSKQASGEFTFSKLTIKEQVLAQIERYKNISKADDNTGYIAYFQNFSNTYDKTEILTKKYNEALDIDKVEGLAIATRPDCIDDDVLNVLRYFNNNTHLWIELGFQTSNENTAHIINRGYENTIFNNCISKLNDSSIKMVAHVIFGLPTESYEDYIETIKYIKALNIWGIKIHSLYIQNNTLLKEIYDINPFHIITFDEYTDAVSEAIKILDNKVIIHRITGDCQKSELFEPRWSLDKIKVINCINKKLSK